MLKLKTTIAAMSLICFFSIPLANSQEIGKKKNNTISKLLSENNEKDISELIRNMPNIEVGRGITFMPKNESYKMTMRFRMQNMVGLSFNEHYSLDKTEAQV